MAYLVVENFSNGLDHRRSRETAPPGSLRVLRNAFINEGGEIEKRKAFSQDTDLTAYGQTADYKGRITGPHECPGFADTVMFRHRFNSLPGGSWAAGGGSVAEFLTLGGTITLPMTFWAMKSTIAVPNFGALYHASSYSEFASKGHVVEGYWPSNVDAWDRQHISVTFTNDEPTAEAEVAANADRTYQMTLKDKGYLVKDSTFYASAVADPTDMAGTGSGAADMRVQSSKPIGEALSIGEYFGQMAVFGERGIQFWTVDPDFASNQYERTIQTSFFAQRSVTGYANGDVLFLSRSGIRSLRSRDSSNLARVDDVGSAIDRLIKAELNYSETGFEAILGEGSTTANAEFYSLAIGVVDQQSGQFWLCIKDKIFVLSNYPSAKVLAWSQFDLPQPDPANENVNTGLIKGQWVADICPIQETLIFRNFADEVFIYGGLDSETYDDSEVEVVTPHMDAGKPGHKKHWNGIDLVCDGEWLVQISLDPKTIEWETVAEINNSSHRSTGRIPFDMDGHHIAVRLTCSSGFAARLGQVILYYDELGEK